MNKRIYLILGLLLVCVVCLSVSVYVILLRTAPVQAESAIQEVVFQRKIALEGTDYYAEYSTVQMFTARWAVIKFYKNANLTEPLFMGSIEDLEDGRISDAIAVTPTEYGYADYALIIDRSGRDSECIVHVPTVEQAYFNWSCHPYITAQ